MATSVSVHIHTVGSTVNRGTVSDDGIGMADRVKEHVHT